MELRSRLLLADDTQGGAAANEPIPQQQERWHHIEDHPQQRHQQCRLRLQPEIDCNNSPSVA